MSWKRTCTTSVGKIRHTGYYRDPSGATRSAGTFTRVKDAFSAVGRGGSVRRRGRSGKSR